MNVKWSVYLFDARQLFRELRDRGIKIGVATSVRGSRWATAEIYPRNTYQLLTIKPTDTRNVTRRLRCIAIRLVAHRM